jgi:hypothetical protein
MNPYKSQLLNEIQLTKKMGNVPNLKILFNDNDNFSSFDNKKNINQQDQLEVIYLEEIFHKILLEL